MFLAGKFLNKKEIPKIQPKIWHVPSAGILNYFASLILK